MQSVNVAGPIPQEKQEKLNFLERKSSFLAEKMDFLRQNVPLVIPFIKLFKLINFNNHKITMFQTYDKQLKAQKEPKMGTRLQAFISKAVQAPVEQKIGRKTIEDPREGITRRYANYIPIKRYQYTEDTLNIFYPNAADKYYKKISQEWTLSHENRFLRNSINEDMTLFLYISKYGEASDVLEIYKEFRGINCQNDALLKRFRGFREKVIKKRTKFAAPGCSAKAEEGLTEHTIIKTHKELFCRRCEVYDCGIHGILGYSNFMHPNAPSLKEMGHSYASMAGILDSEERGNQNERKPCGNSCYLLFNKDEVKALQVFEFDPCNIRLYFNKEEVTCSQIFWFLKKEYGSKNHFKDIEADLKNANLQKKEIRKPKANRKKSRKHFFPNLKKLEENISGTFAIDFQPCYHKHHNRVDTEEEQSCMNSNCCCYERGYCDKYCGCDIKKCKIRRKGCDCKSDCLGKKCPCYMLNAECDPDLCKCCFVRKDQIKSKSKTNNCKNQMIFFKKSKNCKIGPSEVCTGIGLFNIEPIQKGEFVCMYIGELISWEEAEMREKWNEYDQETYLCTISDEHVIDAKYRGNKARFINHGKEHANLFARHVFSRGLHHFGFYAKDDIQPGTELLFDYEGGGSGLKEQFNWIKHPNSPKVHPKFVPIRPKEEHFYKSLTTGAKLNPEPNFKLSIRSKVRKLRKIETIDEETQELIESYVEVNESDDDEESIESTFEVKKEHISLVDIISTSDLTHLSDKVEIIKANDFKIQENTSETKCDGSRSDSAQEKNLDEPETILIIE